LIAQNPVAGAHFFKYMVQLIIKHVFGVGVSHLEYMETQQVDMVLLNSKED